MGTSHIHAKYFSNSFTANFLPYQENPKISQQCRFEAPQEVAVPAQTLEVVEVEEDSVDVEVVALEVRSSGRISVRSPTQLVTDRSFRSRWIPAKQRTSSRSSR